MNANPLETQRKKHTEVNLEKMMDVHGNEVLRIAYIYLKDIQRAEDAFQEVFLRVYQKFEGFNNNSSEKTWITRITINVCKDMLRSSWIRKVLLFDNYEVEKSFPNIDNEVIQLDENKYLFSQILTLPPVYKDVVILYYYQELNTKEISMILKVPEGTIRSRLHRARELLRDNIKERMGYSE